MSLFGRLRKRYGHARVFHMPRVRAIPHPWGDGYAFLYRHGGETFSSRRRAAYPTAEDAIVAGEQARARQIEWEAA